jgi:hypothetical protein
LQESVINDFDPSIPQKPLTFDEVRELVNALIARPVTTRHDPARPVTVTYEISGPNADEFRAAVEGR